MKAETDGDGVVFLLGIMPKTEDDPQKIVWQKNAGRPAVQTEIW